MDTPETVHEHYADRYQIALESTGEILQQITTAVTAVVDAYVKGCSANGFTPAKYIVRLQTQVQELAEKLADSANRQEAIFNKCLADLTKTLAMVEETGEVINEADYAINPYYRRTSGKPFWADMSEDNLKVVLSFLHADDKRASAELDIYKQLMPLYKLPAYAD